MKIRRIDEMVGTERRPFKACRGRPQWPPNLGAPAYRRQAQRSSPTALLSFLQKQESIAFNLDSHLHGNDRIRREAWRDYRILLLISERGF